MTLGIFALTGLVPIWLAAKQTERQQRFGESICRITGKAGVIGKGIKGLILNHSEIEPTRELQNSVAVP